MKEYLNFKDACETIGVKKSTMYNLMNTTFFNGKGDTIVHMRKRYFSQKAIDNYLKKVISSN